MEFMLKFEFTCWNQKISNGFIEEKYAYQKHLAYFYGASNAIWYKAVYSDLILPNLNQYIALKNWVSKSDKKGNTEQK